jgi:hypothetical protein
MMRISILLVLAAAAAAGVWFAGRSTSKPVITPPAKPLFNPTLVPTESPDTGKQVPPNGPTDPSAPVQSALFAQDTPRETSLRFEDGTSAAGVKFQHVPDRSSERYMPEIIGSGLALADFNRDGAVDLFCVNSGSLVALERPANARHRLFINDGKGRFTDETDNWNIPDIGYGMGVAAADYDNDGNVDLLITSYSYGELLLRNTGDRFENVTESARIQPQGGWSTSAGFFDMDADGDLDLYVARYVDYTRANALRCYANRIHIYCTPVLYAALPDRLLENNGDGTFTDVSTVRGLPAEACKGLAVGIGDIDQDGDVDVYVGNDTSRNFLLINDGKGHFTDIGQPSGVAYSETGVEEASMGADFSDFDDDDLIDIVCTNFQSETTCLYRQGDGLFFREVSDTAGVGRTARSRLSFGVDFFDADNDGDEDLIMANGHIEDNIESYREGVYFKQLNTLYENVGGGRLIDVTERAGPALADRQVSRGAVTGDIDADGDLDYAVANNGGTAQIGINTTANRGNFVSLWLEGVTCNRSAIGARVETTVNGRVIKRQVVGACSFLSSSDPRVHLGLADHNVATDITIRWPDGQTQVLNNLPANAYYHVVQGKAPRAYTPGERRIQP